MTYALACMRTDASAEQLAEALRRAVPATDPKTVEDLRQRAERAFEELENQAPAATGEANPQSTPPTHEEQR